MSAHVMGWSDESDEQPAITASKATDTRTRTFIVVILASPSRTERQYGRGSPSRSAEAVRLDGSAQRRDGEQWTNAIKFRQTVMTTVCATLVATSVADELMG